MTFIRKHFIWVYVIVVFTYTSPLQALMTLPMKLQQMVDKSGKVFTGTCRQVTVDLDEQGMPATFLRFQVNEGLKGVHNGENILVKIYGKPSPDLQWKNGQRIVLPLRSMALSPKNFEVDHEYLLFLYPDSTLGFTSPVGAGQGLFTIDSQKEGAKLVTHPLGQKELQSITGYAMDQVPLEVVLQDVRKLVHEK